VSRRTEQTPEKALDSIAAHRELARRAMLSTDLVGRVLLKRHRPDLYVPELAGAPIPSGVNPPLSAERLAQLREAASDPETLDRVLTLIREAREDFERAGGTCLPLPPVVPRRPWRRRGW
jgi:hypothetical protein